MTTTPHAELLTDDEIDEMWGDANRGFCIERDEYFKAARDTERALLARLGGQQPVCWAIFDSQGFYEAALDKDSAERFAAHYNARAKGDPLKPYSAAPLYAHPPAAQPVAQGERPSDDDILALAQKHGLGRKMRPIGMQTGDLFHTDSAYRTDELLSFAMALMAARSAAQGAVQVPAGWKLVPVEPTDAMLDATTTCHKGRLYPQDSVHGPRAMRRREYVAMLAAAPAHAGERQGDSA